MGSAVSMSAGPRTSRPSPETATELSRIPAVSGDVGERQRESDDSSQNAAPTSLVRRILRGAQNMWVKAGQAVGGWFAKLLARREEGEMAPAGGNTVQRQSSIHDDVENPPDQRADAAADPNNTQNLQQTHNGDPLRGHSTISKILCGANLVLIVAIIFLQIAKPTHPYRWIAIAELSIQSAALVVMMIGFHVGEQKLSAAMWLHRTGHMLFLEGIAIAAVYRFHWSPGFIPLVLLPVPTDLYPSVVVKLIKQGAIYYASQVRYLVGK
ncbi:hypothetical protein Cgig2_016797 [Carnegiea gigantea]|uniref:Uncharacterized protein n=1 Tax=Carnegiea gigantea TaxID=171969 RepID=A0A9Q1H0U6_9CARY|nr:hypothetical protein Cgig2_016797 [Carnegiea gigantea]